MSIKRGLVWGAKTRFNVCKFTSDLSRSISRLPHRHTSIHNRLSHGVCGLPADVRLQLIHVRECLAHHLLGSLDVGGGGTHDRVTAKHLPGQHSRHRGHALAEHFQKHVSGVNVLASCHLGQRLACTTGSGLNAGTPSHPGNFTRPCEPCLRGLSCRLHSGQLQPRTHGNVVGEVHALLDEGATGGLLDGSTTGSGETATSAETDGLSGTDDSATGGTALEALLDDGGVSLEGFEDLLARPVGGSAIGALVQDVEHSRSDLQCGVGQSATSGSAESARDQRTRSRGRQTHQPASGSASQASADGDRGGDEHVGKGLHSRLQRSARLA